MISRFIPSSLFIRFILIIILPTIFAQAIATYIFYNKHWHSVSKNMARSLSNDIKVSFDLRDYDISKRNKIYDSLGIQFEVKKLKTTGKGKNIKDTYAPETEFLYFLLKEKFSNPIQISFLDKDKDYIKTDIFIQNKIYSFVNHSKRVNNPTTYIFILWMTGTGIIFIILSIIFTKNQIRPIIKLARAADKFGKGQPTKYLKPEGASEIRKASVAFLKMKERIERQISHRTEMLAGVSHDLRTPITRMKLQIELSKDPEIKKMMEDMHDMEYMINSYLDFARGDTKEVAKTIVFNKFIEQIISKYNKQNFNCTIMESPKIKLALKTNAIKRCFQNLLDNAFKYGQEAIVNSYVRDDYLHIEIHDDGVGIPIEKREEVFKPFFRLEESRNKETGGVGLGLAITKDIIGNHGGQIYLESSELLKGLKVIITLPL